MSKNMASGSLSEVRIERPRRHTQGPTDLAVHRTPKVSTKSNPEVYGRQVVHYKGSELRNSDFAYANDAYVGSLDDVRENRLDPPTSVIREQYWACSKWPYAQKILAIAVGVLLGAVIGLALTVTLRNNNTDIIPGFLRSAPD